MRAAYVLRSIVPLLSAFSLLTCVGAADKGATAAATSEARLRKTVEYLASDELEGRGPGTAGIDKAADFLAEEFKRMGLRTDWIDGGPFQKFPITTKIEMGPKDKNRLTLVGPAKEGGEPVKIDLILGENFNPAAAGGTNTFDAPLVFAGYGITSKDHRYDDYAGLDVKGKVVVLLRKEPQQNDEHSKFDGKSASPHATFDRKIANASEHGAAAILFLNEGAELATRRANDEREWNSAADKLHETHKSFQGKDKAGADKAAKHFAEMTKISEQLVTVGKRLSGTEDHLLGFERAGNEGLFKKLPVFFALRSVIEDTVQIDLTLIEKEIDGDLKPRSRELTGWSARGETDMLRKQTEAKNVIASIEGEGPLANETIIIGAHYDHLGLGGGPGAYAEWTNTVHNGADDNASGTATLVEIAHLLSAGPKPKRRIVFMAFSGEERGLLGSMYYTKHPRFPLETSVAMINLDMVGRLNENKLIVYGTGTATEFDPLINTLGEKYEFKLTKHEGGLGPSDHASFYAKKIPVIHFFTGTHADYHRPSDDTDKLVIDGMRRIAEMTVDTVRAIDAADAPPKYVEIKTVESIASGDPVAGDRPYFGSIPDYSSEEEGVALTGVQPGSPAAKAGVQGGDVIVQFGDSKITNIQGYMSAMSKFKPGDKVKIGVKRGKEVVELEAVLEKRK